MLRTASPVFLVVAVVMQVITVWPAWPIQAAGGVKWSEHVFFEILVKIGVKMSINSITSLPLLMSALAVKTMFNAHHVLL